MNLKIIHIIQPLRFGVAEKICITIYNELSKRVHDVKLILFNQKNECQDLSKGLLYRVIQCNFFLRFFSRMSKNPNYLEKLIGNFRSLLIQSNLYEGEIFSRNFIFKYIAYFSHVNFHLFEFKI